MKNDSNTRWLRLALGTVSMLFAGIIYAWSILKAPIAAEFQWTASNMALNFTLTMCFFCVGGIVTGLFLKKASPRLFIVLGGLLACTGFVLTSLNRNSLFAMYLSYGVLCGAGIGMAYNAIISSTNAWFPDKRGLSSGCLMMGFGASSLLLGGIADKLITLPAVGWRKTYVILGVVIGAVLVLAGLFAKFPTDAAFAPAKKADRKRSVAGGLDIDSAGMLKRPSFWKFYLYSVTLCAVGSVVISAAKDLSMSVGASAALSTALVGVLATCNGLGRLLAGAQYDRFGSKAIMYTGNALAIAAAVAIFLALLLRSVPLCVLGMCLCGLSYGFSPTISSAVATEFYGETHFSLNFSIVNTLLIPASFIATLVGSIVTATGSYLIPLVLLIALSVASLVLNTTIKRV